MNHSTILPLGRDKNFTVTTNFQVESAASIYDGLLNFPFYDPPYHHWAIRANGRWECDDDFGYHRETHHQVWVRSSSPLPIIITP